ncbi:MAG: C-methyltransferase [archaeon GW2011_AR3]|nr:MAG: C-methyltransferase [archaeon GW2011_AR3]MBS3109577.1 class I SAM-dependent methyltransferase [Candidatus Woesearchaeota archaeon]
MQKKNCRMCRSNKLHMFLDLGFTALADGFITREQLNEPEKQYPLRVCVCRECGLFQLDHVVPPDELYRKNYPYLSSVTKTGREHFHGMATSICKKYGIGRDKLAIDVGSNIGVLLEGFKSNGLRVLGIDPADNIVEMANKRGIETWPEYFNGNIATKVLKEKGRASVITGTNVFAHIDDLDDMMDAVSKILEDDGIFVFELPYLVDLLDNLEYDTIYHEHLSYISIKPLVKFFRKFKMELFDVERTGIHGGSIRVFVCKKGKHKIQKAVDELVNLEDDKKVYDLKRLEKFSRDVQKQKEDLIDLLRSIKKQGKRIVGLSAPAKGNTLLNYCKIGTDYLDYVTEKAETKIGLYTPGTHIEVKDDASIIRDRPGYALLLAWNFAPEIIKNMEEFRKNGGKFIIPIPAPKVV